MKARPTLFTKSLLAMICVLANFSYANTTPPNNPPKSPSQLEAQRQAELKAKLEAEARARAEWAKRQAEEQAMQQENERPTRPRRQGDFYHYKLTQDPHTGKYGVIDHQGKIIIDTIHDKLDEFTYVAFGNKSVYFAKKQGKYGIYDHQGGIILPFEYDNIGELEQDILPLSKNGKWGMIKFATDRFQRIDFKKPYQVMVDFRLDYDFVHGFIDELSLVHKNDKYGFIDKTGNPIIPLTYDAALPFYPPITKVHNSKHPDIINDPIAFVGIKSDDKMHFGAIDTTGKVIIPIEYDSIQASVIFTPFAIVSKDNQWSVFGRNGSRILPNTYDKIQPSPLCFGILELINPNNEPRKCTLYTLKNGVDDKIDIEY